MLETFGLCPGFIVSKVSFRLDDSWPIVRKDKMANYHPDGKKDKKVCQILGPTLLIIIRRSNVWGHKNLTCSLLEVVS
jgi:hypothetical protein